MIFLLEKIVDLLKGKDGLTIPEIQHELKAKYGMVVLRKRIDMVIDRNPDKLDAVYKSGNKKVIITPKYREYMERYNINKNED